MTSFQDYMHYEYPDETGLRLVIHRDASAGCAWVTVAPPEERRPLDLPGVAVLAEHVPEVCRQLTDKAGAKVAVLDTSWMADTADVSVISDGGKGWYQVAGGSLGVVMSGPQLLEHRFTATQARSLAAGLALHADRAEKACADVEVTELADILARHGHPVSGADRMADARAVLAAGYRKAET